MQHYLSGCGLIRFGGKRGFGILIKNIPIQTAVVNQAPLHL